MSKYKIVFILIIALAVMLRFYKLGQVPVSLDWDEVSMGYNAWALGTTGHDEFGNSWPLTIKSFGDYKPPLYTYLLIPSLKILGRTEFAVRFPSALVGTLTVLITYFLAGALFPGKEKVRLWASLFLAINPWHLQFSRVAFEANLGLFWFVSGIWLFLGAMREKSWLLTLAAISFGLGMMSYHSNRVITPLMIFVLTVLFWNKLIDIWRRNRLSIMVSMVLVLGIISMIGYTLFYQKVGQARFQETSLMSSSESLGVWGYGKKLLSSYLSHYNLKFWFLSGDGVERHKAFNFGLLYWWEFPLLVVGLFSVIRRDGWNKKAALMLYFWLLLAPAASALAKGSPSAVRSLLFLPVFQILEAVGLVVLIKMIKSKFNQIGFASVFLVVLFLNLAFYLHQYYIHGLVEQSRNWEYGYKELVRRVDEERVNYEKVVVTTAYDQPYIYFLWYGVYDPTKWVNNGEGNKSFDKLIFSKINWSDFGENQHWLVIGTSGEIPLGKELWRIDFLDGGAAFVAAESGG